MVANWSFGRSAGAKSVSPGTDALALLREITEPSTGMSSPNRTLPSMITPPIVSGALRSESMLSSIAANFDGWADASRKPARWPTTGWATAAIAAKANGMAKPSRWW